MAIDGHFLGGVAEGISNRRKDDLAERTLEQQGSLQERALGIQERAANQQGERDFVTRLSKGVADSMKFVHETVKTFRENGATPEQTAEAVAPLLTDVVKFAPHLGQDPTKYLKEVEIAIMAPTAAQTELGKLRTDLATGHIDQQTYDARLANLNRESEGISAVETIRRKIASGQTLTAGEDKVYTDSMAGDPMMKMIFSRVLGGQPTSTASVPMQAATPQPTTNFPEVPTGDGAPRAAAPNVPTFKTAEEFQAARKAGKFKAGDRVIVNGQAFRVK